MIEKAERLKKLPPYLFKEIDRKKEEIMARGVDIIDLGVGDPDLPTPPHIIEAMKRAPAVIERVGTEFEKATGRAYGLVESYQTGDAERIVVAMGSTCGTAKAVVDDLRGKGEKVGLLKIRSFRPFPYDKVREALAGAKAVGVLDRAVSFGSQGGPLAIEVRSALYDNAKVPIKGYIYGLGGRDMPAECVEQAFDELKAVATDGKSSDEIGFLGVRE